jgi:hypothetical protein
MSAQNPWRNNCFWKGLHTKVPGLSDVASTPQQIVKFLQKHNVLTRNVTWQGQPLDAKLMMQNFIHVQQYDSNFDGHLTSSCDVFLLLVAQLFRVNIDMKFAGTDIQIRFKYTNAGQTDQQTPIPTIRFRASRTHFS